MYILLLYIVQTTRVHFDTSTSKNKLSLWPYWLIMLYLVSQMLVEVLALKLDGDDYLKILLEKCCANINCCLWSALVIVQCFEWSLITSLVRF